MKELIAKQVCESGNKIIIQKCYLTQDKEYENISEEWVPKIPFFMPPAIFIFRWAYHITNKTVYTKTPKRMVIHHKDDDLMYSTVTTINKEDE